ncbi:MAG TPA: BON domain-containing protein [Candidatus Binataceae bacterium]
MAPKATSFICASIFAAALAFSPNVRAQTASEWGHAAVDTGKDAVRATEHAFHQVADDPILTERTKSALAHDPITRNQPIIVSVDKGIVTLQGRVARSVADRALQVAAQVSSRGVRNEMLYDGGPSANN